MAQVRPLYSPPPYQDSAESGRLILRDGTIAMIRVAQQDDAELLQTFFHQLTPESRRRRFFSVADPGEKILNLLCNSSDPQSNFTLIASRTSGGITRCIATGSYFAYDDKTAEFAVAVDDAFHGKGLATLLLERLALIAVRHGFTRFWAITESENRQNNRGLPQLRF